MTQHPFSLEEITDLIHIAERAAITAGIYLLEKRGQARIQAKKASRDDLLDVDLEAERIILETFHVETPHLGILSEEMGFEKKQDHYWIIDPLDGSANFQHGSPLFAIAIALIAHEQTQAGIIYLPASNEMFTAMKQHGAYLNKTPIQVSNIATLNTSIVHFGDFTKADDPQASSEGLRHFSQLVTNAQRIRMIGTAATDLAYVACGRADALVNSSTHPWDIEAGKLLVQEAGGQVTTFQHGHSKPLTLYSNNFIHQAMKELLNK